MPNSDRFYNECFGFGLPQRTSDWLLAEACQKARAILAFASVYAILHRLA